MGDGEGYWCRYHSIYKNLTLVSAQLTNPFLTP